MLDPESAPIEILFVHIKSSDVCNFAGILISLLLFLACFSVVFYCRAPHKELYRAFD
jgi:hypothetical protein